VQSFPFRRFGYRTLKESKLGCLGHLQDCSMTLDQLRLMNQPSGPYARDKRLNEMNRLSDVTRLPVSAHIAAVVNVMLTVFATFYMHRWYWELPYLILWIALVMTVHLLPIAAIRVTSLGRDTYYPSVNEMRIFRDLHKLSDWVYVVASAHAAFWIVVSWVAFTYRNTTKMLVQLLSCAFLWTLLPVWLRLLAIIRAQGSGSDGSSK